MRGVGVGGGVAAKGRKKKERKNPRSSPERNLKTIIYNEVAVKGVLWSRDWLQGTRHLS